MLRATTGHIYRLADLLGRGVSCNVYKGVDKNTGKERALKIFNVSLPAHLNEALKREIEALKTLTHPNVVSFLGLEMEVTTGHQVLVMELCTGGTLLTVLSEPQFAFGLSEDEFRLFLCHIVCGLKHLRTNGFVHRDIKPGNILRSIGPDGKSVYKLSDFGSAKKLDLEGEQFMSMHGTEEYLHPDIFEKAFIDRSAVKQFTLAVDLWSIGATLYHAATGTVPFRPYGGRKNKATMFEMIAMKSGGVISGVQDSLNGPIEWDTKLPGTCLLSSDMRTAVEGMCAGMLEKNPGKMWTFDTFFFETEHLFEKIRVFVFNTVDCISDVLYMGPDSGLAELKGKVERHLGVEISEQILYFGEKPLDTNVRTATKMKDFPNTGEQKPILLFSTRGVERLELEPVVIAAFPVVPTNAGVIEDDCRAVKHSIEVQCGRQRVMESCRRSQELLVQGALSFRTHLLSELSVLAEKTTRESTTLEQLSESVRMSLDELEDVERQESLDRETYDFGDGGPSEDSGRNGLHRMKDLLSEKRKDLAEILKWCERVGEDELCGSYSGERSLEARFGLKVLCAADCECVTGPNWQFGELKSLCKKFEERRRQVRPTYHEEKLHEFDRRHLMEVCEQSNKLLHEHCFPARDKVFHAFKAWHRVLSAVRKDLGYYREQFCGVVTSTEKTLRQYSQVQSYFTSRYRHSNPVSPKHHRSSADRDKKREHCLKIQKLLDSTLRKSLQETSKLREEQSSLLSSFQSLGDTLQDTPDLFQLEDLNVK